MGRRGGPRPGVRFLTLGLALPAPLCTTDCTGPDGSVPSPAPTTASASPHPASDADLCTRPVAYWARRTLADDTCGDYQSMGLSHGRYRILLDVAAAKRPVRQRQGVDGVRRLMHRQARTACAARYRRGIPNTGPWT
ncbi:hypothetical protein SHL15_2028 [Streptomyces hygroscopicus subsp. limoneus]|nr:hypothetical protein SHL15_2028 [Streptomyces hygroscopicus subsp. limoneus]